MTEPETDPLYEALHRRLHHQASPPPPAVWAGLETQLRAHRRARRGRAAGWVAGGLLLLGSLVGGRAWLDPAAEPDPQQPVAVVTPASIRGSATKAAAIQSPGARQPAAVILADALPPGTGRVLAARGSAAQPSTATAPVISIHTTTHLTPVSGSPQVGWPQAAAADSARPAVGFGEPPAGGAWVTMGAARQPVAPPVAPPKHGRAAEVTAAAALATVASAPIVLPNKVISSVPPALGQAREVPVSAEAAASGALATGPASADDLLLPIHFRAGQTGRTTRLAVAAPPVTLVAPQGVEVLRPLVGAAEFLPAAPAPVALDSTLQPAAPARVALGLWLAGGLSHRLLEASAPPLARAERAAVGGAAQLTARVLLRPRLYLNTGVGLTLYRERTQGAVARYVTELQLRPDSVAGPAGQTIRTYTWQNVPVFDDTVAVRATGALRYLTLPLLLEWHPVLALPARWRVAVEAGPAVQVLLRGTTPAFTATCNCEGQPGNLRPLGVSLSLGAGLDYALRSNLWVSLRPMATAHLVSVTRAEEAGRYPFSAALRVGLVYELPARVSSKTRRVAPTTAPASPRAAR